jgi:hypothetical protein
MKLLIKGNNVSRNLRPACGIINAIIICTIFWVVVGILYLMMK